MVARSTAADMEIGRLLEENRSLSQELKQSQADKDFVWSLWKKLQVTNPDVTQAVGLVVQREREKAEQRDRKVLEILQGKDEKIEELQANLMYKTRELGESTIRRADVQGDVTTLQRQVDALQDRNATLELQLKMENSPSRGTRSSSKEHSSHGRGRSYAKGSSPPKKDKSISNTRQMRTVENREKNIENAHHDNIQEYERENRELSQKAKFLSSELEKMRSEKADEMALRVQMENKVRILDRDVEQKIGKFEDLVRELEEARSLLRKFESQVRQQQQDLDYKNHELETVRKELAELWTTHNQLTEHSEQQADLIRQIQSLQTDTQKMMKNQEEAYSLESNSIQQMYTELTGRYDLAKKAESELRSKVLALKKELLDRDDTISELQHKAERRPTYGRDNSGSFLADEKVEPVFDVEYKVQGMQKEIDNLRRQLAQKQGHIEELEEDAINQTIEFDVARLNRHERTHSTPSREFKSIGLSPMKTSCTTERSKATRSRSVSPTRRDQPRQRLHIQKDLDDCRTILKLKIRELAELKKAHSKRQERLKTVQDNYKNVKEQLKTLEAEYYGTKKKQKKVKRADPKELRHEDSGAVWNELAYFKSENRNLVVERMTLEEEVDGLRVQASEDAATIHELKVTLDQQSEERLYEKKRQDRDMKGVATQKSEIVLLKSEVQNKDVIIQRLERDLRDHRGDRDAMLEEKKILKGEIVELKKEASQHRMDKADLKRDIHRLKRELQEEKSISKLNATKAAASASIKTVVVKPAARSRRKGQKSRNNNFNISANRKFDELIEEGWEEMSEDSEKEDEDTGTDTLGRNIVRRSQLVHADTSTSDTGQESPVYKMRRSVSMKQSSRAKSASSKHVQRMQEVPAPPRNTEARANRATIFRDIATSPILESPVQRRLSPAHTSAVRQLKPLKQRVGYLQQQVITLRDSRAAALKSVEELKESNTQLHTDLNLANQRLRVSKQSIQKLNNDLDKLHQEKKEVEMRLTNKMESVGPVDIGHSDHDWRVLESRLKSCTNELTKQNATVKQLKSENESQTGQIRLLQDKVNRAERDSNQKRTLLEDQRSRVKMALENAKADADSLEQLETRMKLLQDTNEKQKIQIDSYKKRLGAVTREKREYEERYLKLTAEVDKKNKLLLDSQTRKMELEASLGEMEKMATQQMKSLARESEDALETAKDKLKEIHLILQAYQRFVKNLALEIVRRCQQTRVSVKEQEQKKLSVDQSNASMQRAQDLAKDILNLSQSDLDEIMSADGDHKQLESELENDRRRDKKWAKKVERTQNSKDDFAMPLMDLFIQKIEERNEFTAKLFAIKNNQSASKIQNS